MPTDRVREKGNLGLSFLILNGFIYLFGGREREFECYLICVAKTTKAKAYLAIIFRSKFSFSATVFLP